MTRTARRTLRAIRRSIRAAVQAGQKLVTAVRGAKFTLLVRLFAAIDRGATVRIGYTDSKGVASERDITRHRLDPTAAGNITCRAFDWRDGEDTTFRADRITLNAEENPVAETAAPRFVVNQLARGHFVVRDLDAECDVADMTNRDAAEANAEYRETLATRTVQFR